MKRRAHDVRAMAGVLIVQLPISESTDFDSLIRIEDSLSQAFEQNRSATVDSHDIGHGRFNIFISLKDTWEPVFERVKAVLQTRGVLASALIVKRLKSSGGDVLAWPENYQGTWEL
jgi:hypothetical protein